VANHNREAHTCKICSLLPSDLPSCVSLGPKNDHRAALQTNTEFPVARRKGKKKKNHLVSWDIVKRPSQEGGLQVRDPGLANLAMGGKILWKIFSKQRHLVSQILIKKYLQELSMNAMDDGASGKGTTLWKLCSRAWDFFKEHLYRIPRNGKRTWLWEDKIMGLQPLKSVPDFADLCVWLIQQGIQMLADISSWDVDGNWLAWAIPRPPGQAARTNSTPSMRCSLVRLQSTCD
jgi:hypothetical protein